MSVSSTLRGAAARITRTRRNRLAALLAAGLVVGVGASATLASWTDSEWVFGGLDSGGGSGPGTPGVGSSVFHVQQSTDAGTTYSDKGTKNGGFLAFGASALALTPGDSAYAKVSLKTTSDSMGGTLAMAGAVQADGMTSDAGLWAAVTLRTVTLASPTAICDATAFTSGAAYVVGGFASGAAITTAGTGTTTLQAAGANSQTYCYQITLPSNAASSLQGTQIAPAWQFTGTSGSPS